jgi:hypothetical protein
VVMKQKDSWDYQELTLRGLEGEQEGMAAF